MTDEQKQQEIANAREKQKISLDAWIDHLTSDNCHYPADIKYFIAQGVLKTGKFDDQTYRFNDREKSTAAPFYQIDHEALSMVMGALEAVHHNGDTAPYHAELLDLISRNKSFGHMYAEAMRYLDKMAEKDKALDITDGEWRVFRQNSDPQELVKMFEGKRAYLCLGNIGDASGYLRQGDMHVYFSNNRTGVPTMPRIAIAVKPDAGAYEVRGTWNANEDIDPIIAQTSILKEYLTKIPNGKAFAKKDADMKKATELYDECFKIDRKTKEKTYLNPKLTKDDLAFLYEIDAPIEGFGYQKDPRIQELRAQRNKDEDMLIIFECSKEEIARIPDEINENTKAYVGHLKSGIFQKLPENLEHIYTSFPEYKIRRENIEIGGKTAEELRSKLDKQNYRGDRLFEISYTVRRTINSREFIVNKNIENVNLIFLTVYDLKFARRATMNQIYRRAEEFGLELLPVEFGPHYRLKHQDQLIGEKVYVGMEQVGKIFGEPHIFNVSRSKNGQMWLNDGGVDPDDDVYQPSAQFVFRLRPPSSPDKIGTTEERDNPA